MQKVVCLKKYFPNQQKKEHRRPHAAAPANNDWLDFPVEWRGHTIGVMSHKPQEQSLNNQSKRRATTTKTHITDNNIKSLCLNVINFWYHTIYKYAYKEGVLYFSIYSWERPIREWLYGYTVMFGHLTKQ